MSDLFDRIETSMSLREMTVHALEERAGLARGHLANILKRRKSLSALTLLDIARALDVTTDWLLTGEGPIERWKADARPVARRSSSPPQAAPTIQEAAAKLKAAGIAAFPEPAKKRAVRRR